MIGPVLNETLRFLTIHSPRCISHQHCPTGLPTPITGAPAMKPPHPFRHLLVISVLVFSAVACAGSRQQAAPENPHRGDGLRTLQKADAWYRKGCYTKAMALYRLAYPDLVAGDSLNEMAICLNNMGNVYLRSGKPESAVVFFDEAIQISQETADSLNLRAAWVNKATALMQGEQYDAAAAALGNARNAGPETASLLAADARLHMRRGDTETARALLADALNRVDDEDAATTAVIQSALGHLARTDGDLEGGFTHFQTALNADRRQSYYRGMADDLKAMGDIRTSQERHREAAGHYKRSISLYALINAAPAVAALREPLAASAAAAGLAIDGTLYFVDDWLENPAFIGPCE